MIEDLKPADFRAFFRELHEYAPFPWQERLSELVCAGEWPGVLDLPTASGKTACLDIAVFRMALTMTGTRRVFFVVDRRVVVDAAFERMRKLEGKLAGAKDGVLKIVADRLKEMGRSESPLDVYQMRGGIYRDDSWVRSPLQPALIASTVDQTGSRLLFRGYGVGDNTLAMHSALVANDALILLDEAHCSRPFSETLKSVAEYRQWAAKRVGGSLTFVEMTATPGDHVRDPFRLEADDFRELHQRLYAPKPTKLVTSKARARDQEKFAAELAHEALGLAGMPGLCRIAVMVNRVKTAKLVHKLLEDAGHVVHLLIGRMRPVDRSPLPEHLEGMLAGNPRPADGGPVFVVATQCLEVGADLDFDAVVTECASIDALLQRFGRLDRIGGLAASGVTAQGRVLIASDQKETDPVYGPALLETWQWLRAAGDEVDFAICSEEGGRTVRERLAGAGEAAKMRREAPRAPVLLPAHLDLLVQTSPRPALEPDLQLYLHGIEAKGSPEVQVVWRADLGDVPEQWADIVALCPPVSAEAMPVPLRDFRAWMSEREVEGASDVEGVDEDGDYADGSEQRLPVLIWRGDASEIAKSPQAIRPGDTLVLPTAGEAWEKLGHVPKGRAADSAELARQQLRRGWILRLHPRPIESWPDQEARKQLVEAAKDKGADTAALRASLEQYREQLRDSAPAWLRELLGKMPRRLEVEAYPGHGGGWVLSGRYIEPDSGCDESSAGGEVSLEKHLEDVSAAAGSVASALIADSGIRTSLVRAARAHDCGKADARFQALLRGGDVLAAQFAPRLLAKGASGRQSGTARKALRHASGLPEGFRHELVSLLLAAQEPEMAADVLALHLVASHHGRCRPFAPVVEDEGPEVSFNGWSITMQKRSECAAHRLDSGVADRFWELTREYGWWGLAYLEALMRLADWKASKEEVGA